MASENADSVRNEISGGVFLHTVIQGRDITVQLPPQIQPALSGLPPGSPAFTGRGAEMAAVLATLDPSRADAKAAMVSAVAGLAGVGKTELAIQAANAALRQGWFPGGALMIDVLGYDPGRSLSPERALDSMLRALGLPAEQVPDELQDRVRLYRTILSAFADQGRRILVIVDNAATAEQVRLLQSATGTIVTSRHVLATLDARLLDLDVLSPPDSVDLLHRVLAGARDGDARVTTEPEDAEEIARLCGYLPLALRIVAAMLAKFPLRPLHGTVADLRDERTRLTELAVDDLAVRAALDLSYRGLDSDDARVFRLLAVNPGPDIATEAAAALTGGDPRSTRDALRRLASAHLVDTGAADDRWRLHDLVRLYAAEHAEVHADSDQRDQGTNQMLRGYYVELTAAAVAAMADDSDRSELSDRPFLHYYIESMSDGGSRMVVPSVGKIPDRFGDQASALSWLDAERANLVAAVAFAEARYPDVATRLPVLLSRYLSRWRHFEDWNAIMDVAVRVTRRYGDRLNEGRMLNELGNSLQGMERFEQAVEVHRQAVASCRRTDDRAGEREALNCLGCALQRTGQLDDAIAAHRHAIAIYRETGNRLGEGPVLGNLAIALQKTGHIQEAIETFRQARALTREAGNRRGEAMILGNIGGALREARRLEEAAEAHRLAIALFQQAGDRHAEGIALANLGLLLHDMNRYDEAAQVYHDALSAFRNMSDRRREAQVAVNLAHVQCAAKRFDEGLAAYRLAATIYGENGDLDRQAQTLYELGCALIDQGQFEEAITILRTAADLSSGLGDQHGVAEALVDFGAACHLSERLDEALSAHRAAVAISREIGDPYLEGRALISLGADFEKTGRSDEAISALREAIAIFRESGDLVSEADALNNLAAALETVGRIGESVQAQEQAVVAYGRAGDRDKEAMALTNVGCMLIRAERFEEAAQRLRGAADAFRQTGDLREEANALFYLASASRHLHNHHEMRPYWLRAREVFTQLGATDLVNAFTSLIDG
jgi:tetratricopeptide (TPR) repeat protein